MTERDHNQLEALAEVIRDDLERAERLGRGTIDAYVVRLYAERLEALVKRADTGEGICSQQ